VTCQDRNARSIMLYSASAYVAFVITIAITIVQLDGFVKMNNRQGNNALCAGPITYRTYQSDPQSTANARLSYTFEEQLKRYSIHHRNSSTPSSSLQRNQLNHHRKCASHSGTLLPFPPLPPPHRPAKAPVKKGEAPTHSSSSQTATSNSADRHSTHRGILSNRSLRIRTDAARFLCHKIEIKVMTTGRERGGGS
jgi:hypothetical protein